MTSNVYTQNEYVRSLEFTIRTLNDSTHEIIRCPKITLFSSRESFRGDSLGYYKMQLLQTDSFRITALGFYPKTIKVKTLWKRQTNLVFLMPFTYLLPEVKVGESGEPRTIDLHLPKDIKLGCYNNVPMRMRPGGFGYLSSNPLGMLANPISTINSLVSYTEKHKRKFQELIQNENCKERRDYLYMNRQIIEDVSGFSGDSLQSFIVKCNTKIKIFPDDNAYSVKLRIRWLANSYRKK